MMNDDRADPRFEERQLGSLRDYWALLLRRRMTVLAVFLIVTATAILGAFLLPPTFTAQATIMIKHGREFFYRAAAGNVADATLISLEQMVNSEVEILSSRSLAEQVVREMGLEAIYPELLDESDAEPAVLLAAAVMRFQDSLTVTDILESSIIRVSLDHRNPHIAAEALNLLVEKFKDKHLEIFGERGFIVAQPAGDEAHVLLAEAEDELEAFRRTHEIYSLTEQRSLLLNQRVRLDTELDTAEFRIAELEQRLTFLNGHTSAEREAEPPYATESRESLVARRGELSAAVQEAQMRLAELQHQLVLFRDRARVEDRVVAPHPGLDRYRSLEEAFIRLLDLRVREKELLRDYSETSRQVAAVREEIALVEEFLRTHGGYIEGVFEATMRDELEGLTVRHRSALEQIGQVDAAIRAFDLRHTLDELAPLEARRARIRQELAGLDDELRGLDQYEKDLRQLERRVTLNERNYEAFVDKSETARVMEALDREKLISVTAIEEAAPPIRASSLPRKLRILLGAFVGLLAGVATAVFLELIGL